MFEILRNSGFQMTFSNGCMLSVQFNPAINYISNRRYSAENMNKYTMSIIDAKQNRQPDAEIAAIDKVGRFITREFFPDLGDDVKGYVTTDEVADLITHVRNRQNQE